MGNITRQQANSKPTNQLVTINTHERQKCVQSFPPIPKKNTPRKSIGDTLGHVDIDSLRVLMPRNDVEVLDNTNFLRAVKTYEPSTGQVWDDEDEHLVTRKYYAERPVAASYACKILRNVGGHKESREYIAIGFSAKLLKENYFEGIRRDNIREVFDFINSEGIIRVKWETFINASVMDMDFKTDKYPPRGLIGTKSERYAREMSVKNIVQITKQAIRDKLSVQINAFRQEFNRGIEFGARDKVYKSYTTKQYLKVYAKLIELKYVKRSHDFYCAHLDDSDINKYNPDYFYRIETTIKNSSHFKTYGLEVHTLSDLLALDLAKIGPKLFERPLNTYLDVTKKTLKVSTRGMSPKDKVMLTAVIWALQALPKFTKDNSLEAKIDLAVEEVIVFSFDESDCRRMKSRIRTRLKLLAKNVVISKSKKLENWKIQVLQDLYFKKPQYPAYDSRMLSSKMMTMIEDMQI